MARLTEKQVQNAAPKAGQSKIKLQDGAGLTLVARAKDRKYWTLRVVADGKTREGWDGISGGRLRRVAGRCQRPRI